MHERPVTWTGRGLRLAFVGDIVLAVTAAVYFLNYSGKLAGFGFFIAGFVGLFSLQRMWGGRTEFGPEHSRNVTRGMVLFFVGAVLFMYALVAGLTTVPETLDMRDLRPPILALGVAIAAETASGAFLLYELCGTKRRAFVLGYGVTGGLLGFFVLFTGMKLVSEYETARLTTSEIAANRLGMFLAEFLPYVMIVFLITRVWVLFLVRQARKEVELAEHDAMAAPPGETDASSVATSEP